MVNKEENKIESTEVGEVTKDGAVFSQSFSGFIQDEDDDYSEEETEDEEFWNDPKDTYSTDDNNQENTEGAEEGEEENEGEEGQEAEEGGEGQPDLSDYSEAAVIAMSLQKDGELPDDLEITKETTWAEVKNHVRATALNEAKAQNDQYIEMLGESKKYVDFLMNGGNLASLQAALGTTKVSKLELTGDDKVVEQNIDLILTAYYADIKLPEDDARNLIQDLKDSGKDVERAKLAQQHFKTKEDVILEADKAQREAYRVQQEAESKTKVTEIETYISTGDVGGFKLTPKEQKELHSAIFQPTEIVEGVDNQGKPARYRVTKIQLLEQEFQKNPKMQVLFAQLLLKGFDTKTIKNQAASDRDDELLDYLNGRTVNNGSRQNRKSQPGKIQSRPVAEY